MHTMASEFLFAKPIPIHGAPGAGLGLGGGGGDDIGPVAFPPTPGNRAKKGVSPVKREDLRERARTSHVRSCSMLGPARHDAKKVNWSAWQVGQSEETASYDCLEVFSARRWVPFLGTQNWKLKCLERWKETKNIHARQIILKENSCRR